MPRGLVSGAYVSSGRYTARMEHQSVATIRARLSACPADDLTVVIAEFRDDSRAGVRDAVACADRRMARWDAERRRLEALASAELQLMDRGVLVVAGVDEVGRGALAGPVSAGACVLPRDLWLEGLDDSKRLSRMARERLFAEIEPDRDRGGRRSCRGGRDRCGRHRGGDRGGDAARSRGAGSGDRPRSCGRKIGCARRAMHGHRSRRLLGACDRRSRDLCEGHSRCPDAGARFRVPRATALPTTRATAAPSIWRRSPRWVRRRCIGVRSPRARSPASSDVVLALRAGYTGHATLSSDEGSVMNRVETGRRGEDAAVAYLERAGLEIVDRNWRDGGGSSTSSHLTVRRS